MALWCAKRDKKGDEEARELIVGRLEGSAASGKASKGRVDDGGGWREKGVGEDESRQSVTKT